MLVLAVDFQPYLPLVGVVVGSLLTAAAGYLLSRRQRARDRAEELKLLVRAERLTAYTDLIAVYVDLAVAANVHFHAADRESFDQWTAVKGRASAVFAQNVVVGSKEMTEAVVGRASDWMDILSRFMSSHMNLDEEFRKSDDYGRMFFRTASMLVNARTVVAKIARKELQGDSESHPKWLELELPEAPDIDWTGEGDEADEATDPPPTA